MLRQSRTGLLAIAEPWPESTPWPEAPVISLAEFLGVSASRTVPDWHPQEPPSLDGIDDIILNFETNGLDWQKGDTAIGVTVGTLDGQLHRFLPFAFQGERNLDRSAVIRYLQTIRGKRITNANIRFDLHMGHNLGVDFESQGNTVSDVMHYAALLDDHRRRFALDELARDYLGGIEVGRVDERYMAHYHAAEVAARAEYQVQLVAQLRNVMWPKLDAEDLQRVRQIEDDCIHPVVEMEQNGSPIDLVLLDQFERDVRHAVRHLDGGDRRRSGVQLRSLGIWLESPAGEMRLPTERESRRGSHRRD